jgi:hypothetical protein
VCGLPPLLPFPPDSFSDDSTLTEVWDKQLKENELIKVANERIQWLLGHLRIYIDSLEDVTTEDVQQLLSSNAGVGVALTTFDLKQIATTLKVMPIQSTTFWESLQKGAPGAADDSNFLQYWNERLSKSNLGSLDWIDLLMLPLDDAASGVMAIYHVDDNRNMKREDATAYLQCQAVEILCIIRNEILPSTKQRLHLQKSQLHKMQTIQKEVEHRYNTAFDQWDDYCVNVLKIESDKLPLCPVNKHDAASMDSFVRDIGKCVVEPLRDEFGTLSEHFVRQLTERSINGGNEFNCYSEDIFQAINYYREFTRFVSQNHPEYSESEHLETLYQFATSNDINSCLLQFMTSPDARVKLLSDLQQLDAFLSCRKRENTGAISRGFGHFVAEAIDMEWTRSNIKCDTDRFKQATHDLLMRIIGDGTQAKRLRLLANAVGYPATQKVSSHFSLLCQRASNLACHMMNIDDQSKSLANALAKLVSNIDKTDREIRTVENRVRYICEELKSDT